MKLVDRTGLRYGRLTVLYAGENKVRSDGKPLRTWVCRCDCGNIVTVRGDNLQSGNTQSCGCIELERPNATKHGFSHTRLSGIYNGMKSRCYNPNNYEFNQYGGRGIMMCDDWFANPESFYTWALANGFDMNASQKECSLDRIDVDKGYCPENCRWTDSYTQANNTRKNIYYTYNDEKHTLSEWSRLTGIRYSKLYSRINQLGWSIEKSLTTI